MDVRVTPQDIVDTLVTSRDPCTLHLFKKNIDI